MQTTQVQLSESDYQNAAEIALFGYLPVPPRVRPELCEAHLYQLPQPTPDLFDEATYESVVFIVTRGQQGPYRETVSIYGADEEGHPATMVDVDGQWAAMLFPRREKVSSTASTQDVILDLLRELSLS